MIILKCFVLVFGWTEVGQSAAFTYEGSHGPENWGSLNPKYATCSNGKSQSPIDIVKDSAVFGNHLQTIVRRYHVANATLVNNGFNIGVCPFLNYDFRLSFVSCHPSHGHINMTCMSYIFANLLIFWCKKGKS